MRQRTTGLYRRGVVGEGVGKGGLGDSHCLNTTQYSPATISTEPDGSCMAYGYELMGQASSRMVRVKDGLWARLVLLMIL